MKRLVMVGFGFIASHELQPAGPGGQREGDVAPAG